MDLNMQNLEQTLLPPADWAGEIERLKEVLRLERDLNLRALADFTNYRRRVEREGNKLARDSKKEILLPLLDIIDDLEKALQTPVSTEQPIAKGVRIIHNKLLSLLKNQGIASIESIGTPFDYNLHEAVAMTEKSDKEPGIVVDELRRGYLWKDELLRPAQVRVTE